MLETTTNTLKCRRTEGQNSSVSLPMVMVNLVFNLQKCYGDKVKVMLYSFCVAQLIFSAMHQFCGKHMENISSQQVPVY